MAATTVISGQYVDLMLRQIYPAIISIQDGCIAAVTRTGDAPALFILPGFVDAHVHIESSMLTPTAFGQMAVVHGTVATVSDPHEIANVCGMAGVEFMIDNARMTPFKCFFGAPSCVPATAFETAGAELDEHAVASLLERPDIWYLSEMMNYPGVLSGSPEVMAKLSAANRFGKPIDGHAPGLRGDACLRYAAAGISTDHECTTLDEALDKINAGMRILIREGSAAANFEALVPLFRTHPKSLMFCSDDKHPDDLETGHINQLAKRAIHLGYDPFDVLWAACVHPVLHYRLPVGQLRVGDPADFIIVDNLYDCTVLQTWIDGSLVAERKKSLLPHPSAQPINHFRAAPISVGDLQIRIPVDTAIDKPRPVIQAIDGQLITRHIEEAVPERDGLLQIDVERDLLKLVVLNRYVPGAKPAAAFVQGFGLRSGALASTIAHDCHNIIAVGADDESIVAAMNEVIRIKGGITVVGNEVLALPLPLAGLMSLEDGATVAHAYQQMDAAAKALGCTLRAPFMTLSFLALLVIPELKLSDRGLFDGVHFRFVD